VRSTFQLAHILTRIQFYLTLPLSALVAPAYIFILPSINNRKEDSGLAERAHKVDWLGFILWTFALTAFTLFLGLSRSICAWGNGCNIACIIIFALSAIGFVIQQKFSFLIRPECRIFPISMLRSWEPWVIFTQVALSMGALFVTIYTLPIFFQVSSNQTAFSAGTKLIPLVITFVGPAMLVEAVMLKLRYHHPWYIIGSSFVWGGGVSLHYLYDDSVATWTIGVSVLLTSGVGMYGQLGYTVLKAKVAATEALAATTFLDIAQLSGICISLVVSSSIYINQAITRVAAVLPSEPRAVALDAVNGRGSAFVNSLAHHEREKVTYAIIDVLQVTFYVAIFAGSLSAVLAFCMRYKRLPEHN
jgi:hypothetical protein